jgi:hypothetical protein
MKVHPKTGHEVAEGKNRQAYSPSVSVTLALEGWSTSRPGCFSLVKESRYLFTGRWVDHKHGQDGRGKSRFQRDSISLTTHPVSLVHTKYALPAHHVAFYKGQYRFYSKIFVLTKIMFIIQLMKIKGV